MAPSVRCAVMLSVVLLPILACGRSREAGPESAAPSTSPNEPPARIVCLGDSLTAGYGLEPQEAWPVLVQERLAQKGYDYEIVNAGVSGDTSAGGLRRLDWSLEGDVRVLVLALGANDGLRGLPTAELKRNLDTMVQAAQARGVRVLLVGMELPPNLGPEYSQSFRQVYRDVAQQQHVAGFLPFLLDGVAGQARFNQGDSIHPNALGTRLVAENVWQALEPLLAALTPGPSPRGRAEAGR